MARPLHDPQQRFWEQVEGIRDQYGAAAIGPPEAGATPRYLMEPGHVLARKGPGEEAVRARLAVRDEEVREAHGVVRFPVPGDVSEFARTNTETRPNHLVTITPVNSCPADEPTIPPYNRSRPLALTPQRHPDESAGQGVEVLVVDTGLVPQYQEFDTLRGTTGLPRDTPSPGVITQYYGHGTFIAGVLKNTAPGVDLRVWNHLQHAGTICEFDLGRILLDALPSDGTPWPAIISLSAGAPSMDDAPLLGLEKFVRTLVDEHPETVLVAAAGNDGEPEQPFWPAALAHEYADSRAIVAVGALREDLAGRACFSNCGEWVSVYAPGERLTNTFAYGTYKNVHGATRDCRYHPGYDPLYRGCTCVTAGAQGEEVTFHGYGVWSGTSFATPIVAGRIARCMDLDRKWTSREAARYLLSRRVHTITDAADGRPLPVLFDKDGDGA
ncbi:S8/S53 family peptidase [Dactylosporangium sp. CS-047395]|uniref:S8/S53 family peptidase n=1 Tax=Dactylosporangium sp. CS-047395 TaxID=3239936 RepID=UPI003D8F14DC